MKRLFVVLMLALVCLSNARAGREAGTAGAQFLRLNAGARSAGLGNAYTAMAEGADAVYWNPAGVALSDRRNISLSNNVLMQDITTYYLASAVPLGSRVSIGFGVTSVDLGVIERTTVSNPFGMGLGSLNNSAYTYQGQLALRLSDEWNIGVGARWIKESLAYLEASSAAADAGLTFRPRESAMQFGLAVLNLGKPLRYRLEDAPLPLTARGGFTYRIMPELLFALDVGHVRGIGTSASLGAEYALLEYFTLRLGYDSSDNLDNGFSLGLGVNFRDITFDYAYRSSGYLGGSNLFSMNIPFGAARSELRDTSFWTPIARDESHETQTRSVPEVGHSTTVVVSSPQSPKPAIIPRFEEIGFRPLQFDLIGYADGQRESPLRRDTAAARLAFTEGARLQDSGESAASLGHLIRAVALDPSLTDGWLRIGVIYVSNRDLRGAVRLFYRAYQIEPEEPVISFNLGVTYQDLGDYRTALSWYRRSLQLEPTNDELRRHIETLDRFQKRGLE